MRRANVTVPGGQVASAADYRQAAFRIVGAQTVVTLLLAVVAFWWRGAEGAWSALIGGGICVVGNASLAARMFRVPSGSDPRRLVRAFYAGEVLKIALTAGLFAVAIMTLTPDVLVLLLAYLATATVFWFALVASEGRQHLK